MLLGCRLRDRRYSNKQIHKGVVLELCLQGRFTMHARCEEAQGMLTELSTLMYELKCCGTLLLLPLALYAV